MCSRPCQNPDTRHRPRSRPAIGGAGRLLPSLPRRSVRNDWARSRARGARMVCIRASRMPLRNGTRAVVQPIRRRPSGLNLSLGRRSSPALRTRMDFAACCITDRELSLSPTPPGPHELSRGHALGPSARLAGVNRLSTCGSPTLARNPQSFRPDIVAATASRCRVTKTIATRPSPERDGSDDISPIGKIKNKKRTSVNYSF